MRVFALTTVYNETFFLPRWLDYYSSQVGQENLFVLDHGSTDLSACNVGRANVLRVPRTVFDDRVRVDFISNMFCGLLCYYDAGFVADVDEFIVADPARHRTLAAFASTRPDSALSTIGLELFHIRHLEPEFRSHLPVLAQRRHVIFNSWMSKRSFASKAMRFGGGLHTSDQPVVFDPDLYTIHLKNVDYNFRLARQVTTANWEFAGDHGVHARRGAEYVDEVFAQIDRLAYDGRIMVGFDFRDDVQKCLDRVALNPSDEYDFNIGGGFDGQELRVIPGHFRGLF